MGDTEQLGPPVFIMDDKTKRILIRMPFETLDLPGNYKRLALEERWKVGRSRLRTGVLWELSFHCFSAGLLVPDLDNEGEMAFRLGTMRGNRELERYANERGLVLPSQLKEA